MSYTNGKYDNLSFPSVGLGRGVSEPVAATLINGIQALAFDVGNFVYGSFELPYQYKQYSAIGFHVHWVPNSANTGNCIWSLECSRASEGQVYSGSTILTVTTAGGGVTNQLIQSEFPNLVGTSFLIGDQFAFKLMRNSTNNTFTGNAYLLSVGIHYMQDSLGANSEHTKF